jgi:nicotinamidase/pyrazinamidase
MKTLILVDLQNDFVPGGALAVPDGDQIVPIVNQLIPEFDLVIATQDWHPSDHSSFSSQHEGKQAGETIELNELQQILWPDHCVQNTLGAEFVAELNMDRINAIFKKGTDREIDSYSGFFDNGHRKSTGLGDYLNEREIQEVYICGLATDYCVKFTALDTRQLGFETYLIEDACRGVNLQPGEAEQSVKQMHEAGVKIVSSADIIGGNDHD